MIVEDVKCASFMWISPRITLELFFRREIASYTLSYSAVVAEFVSDSSFQTQNTVDDKLVSRVRSCSVTRRSFYTTANVK